MEMPQRKVYHIPRKVTEGFKYAGLGVKQMLIMLVFVGVTALIDVFTPLAVGAKIVISTLLVAVPYALLTQELGNGLIALEYVKLQLRYLLIDQNDYTLTTARTLPSADERLNRFIKAGKATENPDSPERDPGIARSLNTPVVFEWPNYEKDKQQTEQEKELDDEFKVWLAPVKQLSSRASKEEE